MDLLVDVPFTLMWITLGIGDLIHGFDWPTALVHCMTGVIVGAYVLRMQISTRRARQAQVDYRRAVEAQRAQQTDPLQFLEQMHQHLQN